MTLGEKIKAVRQQKRLTQAELASDVITRNMLSAIENNKATPSLDTLRHISAELDTPLPYFLSDDDDLFLYMKADRMPSIITSLKQENYNSCINQVVKFDRLDDELSFILAKCYFELGITSVKNGSLKTAESQLLQSIDYSQKTAYDTERFTAVAPLYLAICHNVSAPLLEFDEKRFLEGAYRTFDFEFYKYVVLDLSYEYTNPLYKKHMAAKALMKEKQYTEAIRILTEIEHERKRMGFNAYVTLCVYGDLDTCYRQILDFENAYKYATKRLSLLEGFQT